MHVYLTREFVRLTRNARISDGELSQAIHRAEQGLIDAQLGNGLIKQRIAIPGKGRSGGVRTIIVYRQGELAVFVHMFAKNAVINLTVAELQVYREFAKHLLNLDQAAFGALVSERKWRRLDDSQEEDLS